MRLRSENSLAIQPSLIVLKALVPGSSAVEQAAVNRLAGGSNPSRGAIFTPPLHALPVPPPNDLSSKSPNLIERIPPIPISYQLCPGGLGPKSASLRRCSRENQENALQL